MYIVLFKYCKKKAVKCWEQVLMVAVQLLHELLHIKLLPVADKSCRKYSLFDIMELDNRNKDVC